ncbi:Nucleic acid-binding protein [Corchorus olitorius]|uniref:Nucleic acid-binding protein n=1 Tax=Corchorus olitorius TaxID=93759 RepID=A0A1R3GAX2_9ROSI|nr:Nucleic acid-binding protein [Corchorus olitorius]
MSLSFDPKIDEFDIMSTVNLGTNPFLQLPDSHSGITKHRFPCNGSPVTMLSGADTEALSACPYYGAYNTKIASLLIMNPLAMKGLKFKVTAKIIKLQSKVGWYYHSGNCCSAGIESTRCGYQCQVHGATIPQKNLRLSLVIEEDSFKLQAVVFGTLAYRLTGVNVTALTLAEWMNFLQIPSAAGHILDKQYEFILGILNHSYGPALTFKVYRFLPVDATFLGTTKPTLKCSTGIQLSKIISPCTLWPFMLWIGCLESFPSNTHLLWTSC